MKARNRLRAKTCDDRIMRGMKRRPQRAGTTSAVRSTAISGNPSRLRPGWPPQVQPAQEQANLAAGPAHRGPIVADDAAPLPAMAPLRHAYAR
jgi:hypothetical protein